MLLQNNNKISINKTQQILHDLNDYIIKIDYYDQKGAKNFEKNIPLKSMLDYDIDFNKTNFVPYC